MLRQNWFDSVPAQRLLAWERRVVIPKLTALYGCNGLYLRPAASVAAELSGNMLQCVIGLHRTPQGFDGDLSCADQSLPLAAESLALIYAQHVFETSSDGESLAGELARLLAPEGTALVMLLNPLSPWRLRWRGSGLQVSGSTQLVRWLRDAGLDLQSIHGAGPLLPWQMTEQEDIEQRRVELPRLRAAQLLMLRKRRAGMTPLRARGAIRFATQAGPG